MPLACPTDITLAAYIEGTLDGPQRREVERHVDGCDDCRHLIAALARNLDQDRGDPGLGEGERYEILEQLGAGAMGAVYMARDTELDREVALKILHPPDYEHAGPAGSLSINQPGSSGRAERDRLREEARALAKLSHRNIVQVYDVGELDGEVFIAMELVVGRTLRAWLDEDRDRPWHEVLDTFVAAGRGLAAAHTAGIVHRDFKPENVIVADDGRVTVTDFGLAIQSADHTTMSTAGGADVSHPDMVVAATSVGGTPAYMAPELFDGRAADPKTDQFSFCVSLHEGLYGERPSADGPAPASGSRVPRWLRTIVARGLAKPRGARFASMPSLLDRIEGRRKRGRRIRYGSVALLGIAAVVRGGMWLGASTNNEAKPQATPPPVDAMVRMSHAEILGELAKAKKERKAKNNRAVLKRIDAVKPHVDPPSSKQDEVVLAKLLSLECRTWSRLKNRTAAIAACDRAIKLNEKNLGPEANEVVNDYIKVSVISVYGQRWKEAEAYLVRALALARKHRQHHPDVQFVLMNELGQVYLETKRYAEAVKQLTEADDFHRKHKLKLVSLHTALHDRKARALWALGNKKQAIASAEKALEVAKPKGPKALVRQIKKWLASHRP